MALSYAGKTGRLVRCKDQEIAAKRLELAELIRARQDLVRGYYGRRC